MAFWPGWNSIDDLRWWETFHFWAGIVATVLVAFFAVATHGYGSRKDALVAAAQRDASDQAKREQDAADKHHAEEVAQLRSQLVKTSKQVETDHSPKARIRNLFASIDPQILREIDGGKTSLSVRMQPSDIETLKHLLAEEGAGNLVLIKGFGRRFAFSVIMNGTLGPKDAVPEQIETMLEISAPMIAGR